MYYHVLIETGQEIGKSKKKNSITEIDKTDKCEILDDILIPYQNGDEFVVDGYRLTKLMVTRLKVITTEKSAKDLAQYENDTMPPGLIMYVSPKDIVLGDKYTTDSTKELLLEAKDKKKQQLVGEGSKNMIDKTKVFIVHGRDNEAKLEVARFVEDLGLKPIILHEQANKGMTIIEKIESYSNVGFGIVLYTPCDMGYLKNEEDKKQPRARQNVVFEHGYLIAKLGRNKVCALSKSNVEKPNDISGVIYIPFDSNDGWKIQLAKDMKSAGYNIDMNQLL